MKRKARNLLAIAGLLLFGCVLAAGVLEATVRLFFAEPILPRFVVDSGEGIKFNQSNVETVHYFPDQYRVAITTNAAGLRGSENYATDKPQNTLRIALLGDSYLFGYGVTDEQVVSTALQRRLSTESEKRKVEVLNFGVSGYGTAEQVIAYRRIVRPYSPDYVGLFYFSNDLGNSIASGLFAVDAGGAPVRTGNAYLPGMGIRETMYRFPVTRWLFENSQAWNLIRNRVSNLVWRRYLSAQGMKNSQQEKPEAVSLTRALILQLMADVRQDGAIPFVVIIPGRRMNTNFPVAADDLLKAGAVLVDGRDFLAGSDYYEIEGHWRPEGHAKAAAAIAERLFAR